MFYSHDILARKGPLGTIWIAAHLDRKLRKNQVLETDITVSVEAILSADLQKVLALRLSGHLLLGITRIFNRKVNYLYENCETALDKLKQAYKKGNVDLPKEQAVARYEDVTLPDQYVLPDLEAFSEIYATPLLSRKNQNKNVSRPEDITIVDKPLDNPFTDFNDEELPPVDDLDFAGPFDATPRSVEVNRSVATPAEDPFAERFEDDAGFFEPMDMDPEKMRSAPTGEGAQEDQDLFPALDTPLAPTPMDKDDDTVPLSADAEAPLPDFDTQPKPAQGRDSLDLLLNGDAMLPTPIGEDLATPAAGGDVTQTKRTPKRRKVDRVVFDQETVIPGAEMDRRIKNPGDLVRPRKRAPHTGRQIRLQASTQAGLEALMRMPAVSGLGLELQAVVRGMLVKGKPDFLPLTNEAEERRAADDKAKAEEAARKEQARDEEEAKGAEENKGEEEKDAEAPAETDQAPPEPSPKENGIPATLHDDFPMTDDYVPTDDHYDHTMPDGNWDDTAPYLPGENVNKEKQAAGYPGLEDLLTGKTTEEASEVAEGDTPSEDVAAAGGVKGWSVRTRGVANRLQQVFREGGEKKSVPLEGLLEGYGRKTAAKMFFEVLVLKTSNYIDVKQEEPYGNVDLKPTPHLMAAAF